MKQEKGNGVLLIVLDGCRPDGMMEAETPNLDNLMRRGSFTMKARTVLPSITFPCHLSMMYGVKPQRHGIYGNYSLNVKTDGHYSLLDLAHMCGIVTGAVYDWEQLRQLSSPTCLDFSHYRRADIAPEASMALASACADFLTATGPCFCFVNLGTVDTVGHAKGWMSDPYINQISVLDRALGIVFRAMEKSDLLNRFHILILADHGGIECDHGQGSDEETAIPWMVAGPGIKKGHEIQSRVFIYDTAPTVARLLGLPFEGIWHGRVVEEIFESGE